jgi:hypothetical protein
MPLPLHDLPLAYLDPGAGSILLQVLVAGVAAVGVVLKFYWHRIIGLFGFRKRVDDDPDAL